MRLTSRIIGAARLPGIAREFSRVGFERNSRLFDPKDLEVSLSDKNCLVTGANQGIGFAIASALAQRGANVVLLCRNGNKASAAAKQINRLGDGAVSVETADVSSLESLRLFASRFTTRLDVLVHNAGAMFDRRIDTAEDLEKTFALHVVGPQLLNYALLDGLRERNGRVIYVASGGMYSTRLNVDRLLNPKTFDGVAAYALAKRAQVVLAEKWAQGEPTIRFHAMHPGWADTAAVRTSLPRFYRITRRWLRTPVQGADTALWLAAAPHIPLDNGAFVFDRAVARRHILPSTRCPLSEEERLWSVVNQRIQPHLQAPLSHPDPSRR